MRATWKPHEKHGELTERGDLPSSVYAFPDKRKEPMTDASHVRNAIARFDQVRGVSDEQRDLGFANIKKAARHYGVEMSEAEWKELGRRPSTGRSASARRASAPKAGATRKRRGTGGGSTPARKLEREQRDGPGVAWQGAMATCETCGNEYDKTFTLTTNGSAHTFDSFECAIYALAPRCLHCGCTVLGHGVETSLGIYCCAHCAHQTGQLGVIDRGP
jgi:Rieske Fe-S protein